MNPVELERRLQRIERALEDLASAGRPRVRRGSWTPEMYGATTYGVTTYTLRQGEFTLFNNICFIWILVEWSSTTATGTLRVSLPFTSDSSRHNLVIPMRHNGFTYTSGATLRGAIGLSVAYLVVLEMTPSGSFTAINVSPAGFLGFTGMYQIAS